MVERQPGRLSEVEFREAALRIQETTRAGNILTSAEARRVRIIQMILQYATLGRWVEPEPELIRFDAHQADVEAVEIERRCEEAPLDESLTDFLERRLNLQP